MSITALLSIARTAITTHQVAIQTIGQNVANAQTEGYSRQRVVIRSLDPVRFPYGNIGTGISIGTVERSRDAVLDGNYRLESERSGYFTSRRDTLERLQEVLGEPNDSALSTQLDAFWGSWSDLANAPTSSAARSLVAQRGRTLAGTLNSMAERVRGEDLGARTRLADSVTEFNSLAQEIGRLNARIVPAEVGGHLANDLRDERDRLLDRLSQLAEVRVVDRIDGSMSVHIGTVTVVDGIDARTLEVRQATGGVALALAGDVNVLQDVGGSLQGVAEVINRDLPATMARLDALAGAIVGRVNAVHRTGWSAAGDVLTGGGAWTVPPVAGQGSQVDFFDPARVTALEMRLSAAVDADASTIAAGNVRGATGNNAVALGMAGFRESQASVLRDGSATEYTSFADYWRAAVTTVALDTRAASQGADASEVLVTQADNRRTSISGVSIDEEMIAMMKTQQAYAAAAKLVATADEMLQTLIALR